MKLIAILIALTFPRLTAYAGDVMNDVIGTVIANQDGTLEIVDTGNLAWSCLIAGADVFDLLTGLPAHPGEITDGMLVRVFAEDDAAASMVWINFLEDGAAAFKATVSENIQYDENACYFLTGDEKYRVTLTAETVIYDPQRGYVSPEAIAPGDEMFVWVDMVTASCPAQAYPGQVVLIR